MRSLFFLFLTFFCLNACAGLKDAKAYIDSLLEQGKHIAILLIDMQEGYKSEFAQWEMIRVKEDQEALLRLYADDSRVFFVDINMKGQGQTLQELLSST